MSGAPSWSEFARKAGVWSPNLSSWQTGTAIPDGWNLYQLVKEASRVSETSAAQAAITAEGVARVTQIGEEAVSRWAAERAASDARLRQEVEAAVAGLATKAELLEGLETLRVPIENVAIPDTQQGTAEAGAGGPV